MKVTDYIMEFFISKGIKDLFGYPGGVVCHIMDSAEKYKDQLRIHTNYHEQASSFAACGYAQSSCNVGVAYATSGPGATNLLTGIANAYFDSIPTIFLTGQVDTFAIKGDLGIRQKGFQETDIVSMVKPVTKYSTRIDSKDDVKSVFEKAYQIAISGRPGPVLVDLPADIQRSDIECLFNNKINNDIGTNNLDIIINALKESNQPCFILGAGIKQSGLKEKMQELIDILEIPVVTSMVAFDILPAYHKSNFGFIGANGHRYANFILAKSDLIVTFGSRLDLKQVGGNRSNFMQNARIIRVDIDSGELEYKVREDEIQILADIKVIVPELINRFNDVRIDTENWMNKCNIIKDSLKNIDYKIYHEYISLLSNKIPKNVMITTDVGHNQVWVAQAYQVKENQSVFFSGGHGAMGYSLPASIGVHYGSGKPVVSINGDGGFQMNIQELQFLVRENLPILIVILNNHSLGMIRHFQEMNFDKKYILTNDHSGYTVPNFRKIANAYGLNYNIIKSKEDFFDLKIDFSCPSIIEIELPVETYLEPKWGYRKPNHDQDPEMNRDLFKYLSNI